MAALKYYQCFPYITPGHYSENPYLSNNIDVLNNAPGVVHVHF